MNNYLKILMYLQGITICSLAVLGHEVEDCELVTVKDTEESPFKTFNDSLLFSVFPTTDKEAWQASASISDSNGVNCSLVIGTDRHYEFIDLSCPDFGERKITYKKGTYNILSKEKWIDILLFMKKRPDGNHSDLGKVTSVEIVIKQMLIHEVYKSTEVENLELQHPLRMQWSMGPEANIVFNCWDKDCLINRSTLFANSTHQNKPFYLKPGDTFKGLSIISATRVKDLENLTLSLHLLPEKEWRQVKVLMNGTSVKVLVDEVEFKEIDRSPENSSNFELRSIHVYGSGQLTWCDVTQTTCVEDTYRQLIPWIITGVLTITLILLSCYVVYLRRSTPNQSESNTEMSSGVANMSAFSRAPTEANYSNERSYGNVQFRENGHRGSAHDSINSLYGELNL